VNLPALALSGSNCTGQAAYSCALRLDAGRSTTASTSAARGDLAVLCQQLCAAAGVTPAALRHVVVDLGPGSYTGLRVAVTFARTLQAFGDLTLAAATSFELMAAAALRSGAPGTATLRPVLDARRGRWHTAALRLRQGVLEIVQAPVALTTAEFTTAVQPGEVLLATAPLHPRLEPVAASRGAALLPAAAVTADLLLAPEVAPRAVTAGALEPLYLMGSYAG
jgi:tRNA threonylcarbamoyladenosine biosynthesis protein TsaB